MRGMERVSDRALRYLHLLVMPITLLFMMAAEPVTMWLVKGETGFAESVKVFRVVVWGLPFIAATSVLNRMLYTAGKERSFVVIALVSLTFNLVVNVLAIPVYGYMGASVAVVASQAVSTLMHWFYIRRAGLNLPVARSMFNATAALVVAWLATSGLAQLLAPGWGTTWIALPTHSGWIPALAVIGLCMVFYLPALLVTRTVTRADLPVLASLFRRG